MHTHNMNRSNYHSNFSKTPATHTTKLKMMLYKLVVVVITTKFQQKKEMFSMNPIEMRGNQICFVISFFGIFVYLFLFCVIVCIDKILLFLFWMPCVIWYWMKKKAIRSYLIFYVFVHSLCSKAYESIKVMMNFEKKRELGS